MAGKTSGSNKSLVPIIIAGAVIVVGVAAWALMSGGDDQDSAKTVQAPQPKPKVNKPAPKETSKPARTRDRTRDVDRGSDRERPVVDRDDEEEKKKPSKKKKKKRTKKKDPPKPPPQPGF